jgi:surface antigen
MRFAKRLSGGATMSIHSPTAITQKRLPLRALAAGAMALALVGCANGGPNQTGGTIGGAAIGGLLGSQFGHGSDRLAMTALGTFAGAMIGSSIGKQMDDNDRRRAHEAEERAYRAHVGETITWDNPDNGHHGHITPIRDGHSESGAYCREFQTEVVVGNDRQQAYGTACRQPDGSWKIVG